MNTGRLRKTRVHLDVHAADLDAHEIHETEVVPGVAVPLAHPEASLFDATLVTLPAELPTDLGADGFALLQEQLEIELVDAGRDDSGQGQRHFTVPRQPGRRGF